MADISVFSPNGTDNYNFKDSNVRIMIASEFSPSVSYAIGDYCIYNNVFYKCTTAHAAGDWDSSDFTATDVTADIKSKQNYIFRGTHDEWDNLSAAEKARYDIVAFTDDGETGDITNAVTDGDMRAVTSNAVYNALNNGSGETKSEILTTRCQMELSYFEPTTWNGLSNFLGQSIWSDGDNIYYSYYTDHYVLDKGTSTWNTKTWNGLSGFTSFNSFMVWSNGDNIYHSDGMTHYVLDKETSTWNTKKWNGYPYIIGQFIWSDGNNIYYSYNEYQYVLDKGTSTWNTKTWNGLSSFLGQSIWSDGDNIYYSFNEDQYVLDKGTSTWNTKTWNGLSNFSGQLIWSDGDNIYYSSRTNHYIMKKAKVSLRT